MPMRGTASTYFIDTAIVVGALLALGSAAATAKEKTLYDFPGGSNGMAPYGALTADGSGNLYGTTSGGGGGSCEGGCGVVFKLTPDKQETVVYAFAGGTDGAEPQTGLIADDTGTFYGTTDFGGDTSCQSGVGCGTVFKLTPDGKESVLYAFQGGNDGITPVGDLVADESGNLYGETAYGGSYSGSNCDISGCGTVFEVLPDGTKLTLYEFQAGSDGASPGGGVIRDGAGNIYGTTGGGGGSGCGGSGCGTVFKLAPDGTESVLYAFQGGADGAGPIGIIRDTGSNFYGATAGGGNCPSHQNDCGTIYTLAPDGTKTLLYDFQGGNDGWLPWNALIMDKEGNLYGTTWFGGEAGCYRKYHTGCGTVFKLATDGKEAVLYTFRHLSGVNPYASLFLGTRGELYGTTTAGGKNNDGVVFKLKK